MRVHFSGRLYRQTSLGEHMKTILLSTLLLTFFGCTSKGAYESIQVSNRIECSRVPLSQYDECIENTNKPYDEYERERKELLEHD